VIAFALQINPFFQGSDARKFAKIKLLPNFPNSRYSKFRVRESAEYKDEEITNDLLNMNERQLGNNRPLCVFAATFPPERSTALRPFYYYGRSASFMFDVPPDTLRKKLARTTLPCPKGSPKRMAPSVWFKPSKRSTNCAPCENSEAAKLLPERPRGSRHARRRVRTQRRLSARRYVATSTLPTLAAS